MQVLVRIFPTGTHEARLINFGEDEFPKAFTTTALDSAINITAASLKHDGIKYSVISGSIYTGEQLNRV
jgi:hypothetical protein